VRAHVRAKARAQRGLHHLVVLAMIVVVAIAVVAVITVIVPETIAPATPVPHRSPSLAST
jgi:Tfp pilus assembly protein PilX